MLTIVVIDSHLVFPAKQKINLNTKKLREERCE